MRPAIAQLPSPVPELIPAVITTNRLRSGDKYLAIGEELRAGEVVLGVGVGQNTLVVQIEQLQGLSGKPR